MTNDNTQKISASPDSSALIDFAQRLIKHYSGAYSDTMGDPANKSRLQAVSEIHARIPAKAGPESFRATQKALMKAIKKAEKNHEPLFDTEYGSGRPIFGNFIYEIEKLASPNDCGVLRYAVDICNKGSDELRDRIFLNGVDLEIFKEKFGFDRTSKTNPRRIKPVAPEHVKFLKNHYDGEYTWNLKSIRWDFDNFDYYLASYVYELSA